MKDVMVVKGPEPRYRWREHFPGEGLQDYLGYDGDRQFGRIFAETAGPTKGKWRWAISHIDGVKRTFTPHNGWAHTARLAAARCEDFYEKLMLFNGMSYPLAPYRQVTAGRPTDQSHGQRA